MTWVFEAPLSRVNALVPTLARLKTTCGEDSTVQLVLGMNCSLKTSGDVK